MQHNVIKMDEIYLIGLLDTTVFLLHLPRPQTLAPRLNQYWREMASVKEILTLFLNIQPFCWLNEYLRSIRRFATIWNINLKKKETTKAQHNTTQQA